MSETKNLKPLDEKLDLIPLSKIGEYSSIFSTGALRQYQYYNKNGFTDKCIRRVGGRLFVKLSALLEWVEESGKIA